MCPADTKVSEGGREEMLQVLEKIPCNPWRRPWWHTLSCSPWCTTSEQIYTIHCVGRPHTAADGYMLKETAAHGEPTQKQHPTKICSLWRGAHGGAEGLGELPPVGAVLEQCLKGEPLEQCLESCSLWEAHVGLVWEWWHLWEGPTRRRGRG